MNHQAKEIQIQGPECQVENLAGARRRGATEIARLETVPIVAPAALVNVPDRVPVAVRTPLTFEKTMLLSVPVKVPPPLAIVPLTGADALVAVGLAANAVGVIASMVIRAKTVARIGSRSFIASSLSRDPPNLSLAISLNLLVMI